MERSVFTNLFILAFCFRVNAQVLPDPDGELPTTGDAFIENFGQVLGSDGDPANQVVAYSQNGFPRTFQLKGSAARWCLTQTDSLAGEHQHRSVNMRVTGETANSVDPQFVQLRDQTSNYYLPHCGANGVQAVKHWGRVWYENVQPDADLHFYIGPGGGQRMALVFWPGSDPTDMRLTFEGQDSLGVDWEGDLRMFLDGQWIEIRQAQCYQVDGNNGIIPLAWDAEYDFGGSGEVSFVFDTYDPDLPLVLLFGNAMGGPIETPGVCWASYVGGDGDEFTMGSTTDHLGNYYITGWTWAQSINFPILAGTVYQQAQQTPFVTSFNANDNIVWSNYIGGTGFAQYGASVVASDELSPRIFIGGKCGPGLTPWQSNSEYVDPGGWGSFVAGFDYFTGVREWSTYLVNGGIVRNLAWDKYDRLSVVGETGGNLPAAQETFPTTAEQWSYGGNGDGFIVLLDDDLRILWSTFIGGSGTDIAYSVRVNDDKFVVAGYTTSSNFPVLDGGANAHDETHAGGGDASIVEFDLFGDQQWGTCFGGTGYDVLRNQCLAVDANNGDVFLVGYGNSGDLPVTTNAPWYDDDPSVGDNGWLVRFSGADRSIAYMTLVGQTLSVALYAVAVADDGHFFAAGQSWDPDLYTQPLPGLYTESAMLGVGDALIMALTPGNDLAWLTHFGGNEPAHGDAVFAISLKPGRVYVTGHTEAAYDDNLGLFFPLHDPQNGAWFDHELYPLTDAFVASFCLYGVLGIGADQIVNADGATAWYANGTLTFRGLAPGRQTVALYDAAGRCVFDRTVLASASGQGELRQVLAAGHYVASFGNRLRGKLVVGQ